MKKILIIDDDTLYIEMLRKRLELSGYDIVSASNGRDGLEKIEKENPDLVLTDIILPDIGGFQICKTIKSNKATETIKVIVCTSSLAVVDAAEARKSMADEFIDKSSDFIILLKAVRSLLGQEEK